MVLSAAPSATPPATESISDHASASDAALRKGFGPRVRKLHARIGRAHHQAEGMAFSRALLDGQATPLQLAALLRALAPAYAAIEQAAPAIAAGLGNSSIPWSSLARCGALQHDVEALSILPTTPVSAAAHDWLEQLGHLSRHAPHRLMAHVYVRYGGDLSGGQQLAAQANAILAAHNLSTLKFWSFERDIAALKQELHDGFEQLQLTAEQEDELLQEAERAFAATQRLLAELAAVR